MKNFTPYLLIGIILTFVSFVVFGIFSDDSITLKGNTRIVNVNSKDVKQILIDIEQTKKWSLLFKNENLEFQTDEMLNEVEWRKKGNTEWIKLNAKNNAGDIVYTISTKGQDDTIMEFALEQDNKDVEVQCRYKIGVPLVFRFFKKSMKERLTKDLNSNLISLKQFIESK